MLYAWQSAPFIHKEMGKKMNVLSVVKLCFITGLNNVALLTPDISKNQSLLREYELKTVDLRTESTFVSP